MNSPVFLETARLRLCPFDGDDDVERILSLDSDPEVMRYLNGGRPTAREEVRERVLPRLLGPGFWAAWERTADEWLGWFQLEPLTAGDWRTVELGYRLRRDAWGKGYATEGSLALIDKAFGELGVEKVTANTMTVNSASRRVMEKAGLRYVRTRFEHWPEVIDGSEFGDVEYVLGRARWERRREGRTA
ncbi:GNAT family N-acetyltransferase [Streptomyces purpureus]|uniref:GNAT family acetyltransferase n=1 Tax=Streptomyces purpureus TaxID=1951 RepID=A0A918LVS0_9ACTN|nr:GNAT family N-acetyltransferase [Streptomyces purpureus]GGT56798.1 GNAT family acetyltransferase [Streptomyces purpureus]